MVQPVSHLLRVKKTLARRTALNTTTISVPSSLGDDDIVSTVSVIGVICWWSWRFRVDSSHCKVVADKNQGA